METIKSQIQSCIEECTNHLNNELLPFWINRTLDTKNGGFITHFDKDGKDTGEDEKSMLGQARSIYVYSTAHRNGHGGEKTAELARQGVDFLLNKMWDSVHGGFFWLTDRVGDVKIDEKILYGHSFAIYSLSEYTLSTGDMRGLEYVHFFHLQRRLRHQPIVFSNYCRIQYQVGPLPVEPEQNQKKQIVYRQLTQQA